MARVKIADLMATSGVKFGTSGARGLAADMTDRVCYAYTAGFLQYLESIGERSGAGVVAIGGDLRPSTDRIMRAAARAIADRGYVPIDLGKLPTPAVANFGLRGRAQPVPTLMVTGSHIPADRNGIKFTKAAGEISKPDEAGIRAQKIKIPDTFADDGSLTVSVEMESTTDATEQYVARFLDFFGTDALSGLRIGVFGHSAVGRDLVVRVLEGLGAEVTRLGYSETFVAVDTEAIRPEDVVSAATWSREHGFDSIVSTDGDSDRPLVSDEHGVWLRGDVAGVIVARSLGADAVATPVSCNSVVEKCGWFHKVERTGIGSPFVIEAMEEMSAEGARCVVGFEANGGFLLGSDIERDGRRLPALPTRDALMVHIGVLTAARARGCSVSELVAEMPPRFTHSERLKQFPVARSAARIAELSGPEAIHAALGDVFGSVAAVDRTDGVRITFESDEVVHFRPSGNAPEFRCYTEADTEARARELASMAIPIMESWR